MDEMKGPCGARTEPEQPWDRHNGPMHTWFCLSYASYLVLPRIIIQEMPVKWQTRMVRLLAQWDAECQRLGIPPEMMRFAVNEKDENGKFIKNRLNNYRRGDLSAIVEQYAAGARAAANPTLPRRQQSPQ